MSDEQIMSAEDFQQQNPNQYDYDGHDLDGHELNAEDTDHSEFANFHSELEEARQQLVTIRDFIRFCC